MTSSDFAANLLGWKMNGELSQWMKIWLSLDVAAPDRDRTNEERFLEDGRELWMGLRDQAHGQESQDKAERKITERWLKFSAKARKKVSRSGRRMGVPDPASLPDSTPVEICAFLEQGTAPEWASER